MWLLFFSILNAFMSFVANYIFRFSVLELTPAAMIIISRTTDHNIIVSALVLTFAYCIVSIKDFTYAWINIPLAIMVGYLATAFGGYTLILLLYYFIATIPAFFMGYFNGRFVMFITLNFVLNYGVAKLFFTLT